MEYVSRYKAADIGAHQSSPVQGGDSSIRKATGHPNQAATTQRTPGQATTTSLWYEGNRRKGKTATGEKGGAFTAPKNPC